jgi:hypothetical protein
VACAMEEAARRFFFCWHRKPLYSISVRRRRAPRPKFSSARFKHRAELRRIPLLFRPGNASLPALETCRGADFAQDADGQPRPPAPHAAPPVSCSQRHAAGRDPPPRALLSCSTPSPLFRISYGGRWRLNLHYGGQIRGLLE